jgi:hypothetical protein
MRRKYAYTVKLLLAVIVVLGCGASHASINKNFNVIGEATLKVAFFNIYDATLLSPSGSYAPGTEPLLLQLTYRRSIDNQTLVEKTIDELADKFTDQELADFKNQLAEIWPSVSRGDQLAFLLQPTGPGEFFFNGEPIGAVGSQAFNRAFIGIWLGEDSRYPKLARKLKGAR